MKPLPKIWKCSCKQIGLMYGGESSAVWPRIWRICCWSGQCWRGPSRKTKRGAINAWNKVMAR